MDYLMNRRMLRFYGSGFRDEDMWGTTIWMMRQLGRYLPEVQRNKSREVRLCGFCYRKVATEGHCNQFAGWI